MFSSHLFSRLGLDLKRLKNLEITGFLAHSKNYLQGSVLSKLSALLLIPFLAHILHPSAFAQISLFISIYTIAAILFSMGVKGSLFRFYYDNKPEYPSFLFSNFLMLFVYLLIWILFSFTFADKLCSLFQLEARLFKYALIAASFQMYIEIVLSHFQAQKKSKPYSRFIFYQSLLILILSVLLVLLFKEQKYMGRVFAQIITLFFLFLLSLRVIIKNIKPTFKWSHILYSLSYGLPLLPHSLSGFVMAQFDKVIVNQLVGAKETGIYSFGYQIGMILYLIVMATNKSWQAFLFDDLKKKNFTKILIHTKFYIASIVLVTSALLLFANELTTILSSEAYSEATLIVPIVLIGYFFLFLYTIYSSYSFYYKRTYIISLFSIVGSVLNIVLNYIFIPKYGYIAAAYTTAISFLVLFLSHWIYTGLSYKKISRLKLADFFLLLLPIFATISIITCLQRYEASFLFSITFKIITMISLILFYLTRQLKPLFAPNSV